MTRAGGQLRLQVELVDLGRRDTGSLERVANPLRLAADEDHMLVGCHGCAELGGQLVLAGGQARRRCPAQVGGGFAGDALQVDRPVHPRHDAIERDQARAQARR